MTHGFAAELFGDQELRDFFTEAAEVRTMIEVEVALAKVQASLGIIPTGAYDSIRAVASDIDFTCTRQSIARSGVPVIDLVRQLRSRLEPAAANALHLGATSQDIMDTALVVRLRTALEVMETRLQALITTLSTQAYGHRDTLMLARTRWQQALPTVFGLKFVNWLMPLIRHRQRLMELKPRLLMLQLGGAAGTLAALGENGDSVVRLLAAELALQIPPTPWHVQRDGFIELGHWLVLVTGSLGKLGRDVALMSQSELGELSESMEKGRGGSSTLPQKCNPVVSDILVSIAQHVSSLSGSLQLAALAENERGASAWQMEWLSLPNMLEMTACALRHAVWLTDHMVVHADCMLANLDRTNGTVLAEGAVVALSSVMPHKDAKALVEHCALHVAAYGGHLVDCLMECTDVPVAWDELRDPRKYLGQASAIIEQAIAMSK